MIKITVIGGDLYQWDTGRKVRIEPDEGATISEVHFSYATRPDAPVTLPEAVEGAVTAAIPNIALRNAGVITIYAVMVSENGRRTMRSKQLFVTARAKPEDYDETAVDDSVLYILEDETGARLYAVMVEEETVVDATANDIRLGTTAITEDGVVEGTKEIPAYHTTEGFQITPAGSAFTIRIRAADRYAYTKMQAIICSYNTQPDNSVAAEKVCINDNVYAVGSTKSLAAVTLDHDNKSINLGIINESDQLCVIRYFTYKEEA